LAAQHEEFPVLGTLLHIRLFLVADLVSSNEAAGNRTQSEGRRISWRRASGLPMSWNFMANRRFAATIKQIAQRSPIRADSQADFLTNFKHSNRVATLARPLRVYAVIDHLF
jgi:hypothetical protein